jgi:hypothetical protein
MRLGKLALFAIIGLGGCNGAADAPADMSAAPDLLMVPDLSDGVVSTMFPAPHPGPPQVVNTAGGPVLSSPVIVPVFFSNDDATQMGQLEDFDAKIGATNYWKTVTQEYGVGAATATAPVLLTETATGTIADAAIQTWLVGKLINNDPMFPAPTANTVYVLHYPQVVTITLPAGNGSSNSCTSFGGYHSNTSLDAAHSYMNVAYAVIPRCPGSGGLTLMQATTSAESHELVEASTDPYPTGLPAFSTVDDNHRYWTRTLGGGEVGDLCAQDPSSFTTFPELPYEVQRIWSNASATAGHDPCVPPLAGEVYFNAVPELPDTISNGTSGTMSQGVHIPVGMSQTIALDLYSDGDPGGAWSVKVEDSQQLFGGTSSFDFALDRSTGQNGERLHLTIKTLTASTRGTGVFAVISSKPGSKSHTWFGLVGEQ